MSKKPQLQFNQLAPDLELQNTSGKAVMLSSLWQQKPLLLAFTRHFGCTQCKEMLNELVAGKQQIESSGLGIAVVMQDTPAVTAEFAAQFAPGLFCLADPQRLSYKAYGLARGSLFQTFLNLKVWRAVRDSQKKGYQVEPPPTGQDAMLMSGVFIISKEGRIILPYYFDHIADHPVLDLLLHGVLSTRWDKPFDGPIGSSN